MKHRILFVSLLIVLWLPSAMAQYDLSNETEIPKYVSKIKPQDRTIWLDAGAGLIADKLGYQFSFNYQLNKRLLFAVAYDRADYLISDKPSLWNISNALSADLGVMVKSRKLIGYFTFGPAYQWGTQNEETNLNAEIGYYQTNVKFRAGCILRKYSVGISPFFHLNPLSSYAGVTLNYTVGKNVRNR